MPSTTRFLITGIATAILCAGTPAAVAQERSRPIAVDPENVRFRIDEHLVGMHFVYSIDDDAIYDDGKFADWAKRSGIGSARYPGGTVVKFWDWKKPTGHFTGDRWDPRSGELSDAPGSEWMSLDEYFAFARRSGVRPILGVNMLSGQVFDRQDDSVQRAADMVAYAREAGFGGADWYLGNEDIGYYGGVAAYARIFAAHAKAMKAVDPSIKLFWNDNEGDPEAIRTFLANDDGTADGYETHGKYPFGGNPPGFGPASVEEWRREFPLRDRKNFDASKGGRVWRNSADFYRTVAREAGRPGLLIANNEYGLGSLQNLPGFGRYEIGLVLTEMLMELTIGRYDRTAFWSNTLNWDYEAGTGSSNGDDRGLIAVNHGMRLNPFHFGMETIAGAQGGALVTDFRTAGGSHGFVARKDDALLIFVLNKTRNPESLRFAVKGACVPSGETMVPSADGFGSRGVAAVATTDGAITLAAPADSFTRITCSIETP